MRFTYTLLLLFVAQILSAQVSIIGNMQSGGIARDYRVYIPASYTGNTAVPLIINLHGYGSNSLEQEFYGDFRTIADTANFIIVHPNGTFDGQGKRFWNVLGVGSNVDDLGFIRDLLDTIEANYNIDVNRIYSTGMSNGGFMSYSLACDLNTRITAIASVTGDMNNTLLAACNPQRAVPVMEIHGTADEVVPYNGSPIFNFSPIPALVDAWVGFNNCNPTPVFTQVPNTNIADGCTAERYVYSGGDQGSTVEHYKIIDGGHTWPGALFVVGVTNQDFNASKEIWRFFSQYRLDQLTATEALPDAAINWQVYPNPVQNQFTLHHSAAQPVQKIQIFDVFGRLKTVLFPAEATDIQVVTSDWKPGVYFILIEQAGQFTRLKVVKGA